MLVKTDVASDWRKQGARQVVELHINQLTDVNGRDLLFHCTVSMQIELELASHCFPPRDFNFKVGIAEWRSMDVLIEIDMMHQLKLVLL